MVTHSQQTRHCQQALLLARVPAALMAPRPWLDYQLLPPPRHPRPLQTHQMRRRRQAAALLLPLRAAALAAVLMAPRPWLD